MTRILKLAAASTAAFGLCLGAAAQERGASRPNILFIITDDIGLDATTDMYPGLIDGLVEQYGPKGHDHPKVAAIDGKPASTPVLAEFAQQGMVFTNSWAQPFCSPTRASILTGLFSAKTKVLTYQDALTSNHTSFVQKLRDEAGYSTAVFGKWHMAGLPGRPVDYPGMKPKQAGFDLFKGNMHAAIGTYWQYDYHLQDAASSPNEWRTEATPEKSLPGIAPTTYAPVVKAADTLEWIAAQEAETPDKPWFVWLAFNLAHATAQRVPSQMAVPNVDTLDAVARKEMEDCGGTFGSANVGQCSGEALMRAMTNSVDTVIGKVLEGVEGLDPNTYVIIVGDNGTPMYGRPNLDFIDNMYITKTGRGKGTVYESGTRVGLAIKGPGIGASTSSDEITHSVDLFSTMLELGGLEVPKQVANSAGDGTVALDGVSLAPILLAGAKSVRDPNEGFLLAETINLMTGSSQHVGARNKRYKVTCVNGTDGDACEFFNVENDPLEEYALAKPASCMPYTNGALEPSEPAWHYCRLIDVLKTQSFMAASE
jgi:arylsulfatase A-like enzyme